MGGRRDDGYEVRYRLDASRTLRGVFAALAALLVVIAWLAATVLSPRPPDLARDGTRPPATAAVQPQATGPTLPPAIERRVPMADALLPMVSGGPGQLGGLPGLGWLDTRDGQVHLAVEATDPKWLFLAADASMLCVCLRQVPGAPPQYDLRTYGASGEPEGSISNVAWPSTFEARTVADAVPEPTKRFLYVAWARELANERWRVGVDVISREDGSIRTKDVDEVKTVHTLGSPVDIRIWLAPGGRHARVRFATIDGFRLGAPADEGWWAWNVSMDGSTPGDALPIRERSMPQGTGCFAEGWATPRDFVVACQGPPEASSDVITVRATSIDGEVTQRELPRGDEAPAWLINQTTGQLFIWAPMDRHIWRVDIPSLAVAEKQLALGDVAARTDWPRPRTEQAAWLPRGWQQRPPWSDQRQLVGSRDGTVVYALAPSRSVGDDLQATVVWVFDAGSLAAVEHWDAVGEYSALALTPRGDEVVAAGGPTSEELSAHGSQGATIAFHEARGAGISLILRGVTSSPIFLVAEPPPEPN